jgi:hypothetical protein
MVFEHIEKLKREYTDKYVAVDASRPELKRFAQNVGVVRTVNMSGRALVEFPGYHKNIGWYDIDVDFLKIVDKPPESTGEKKPAATKAASAKPAAKAVPAKAAPAKAAAEKRPAPAATGAKKLSVAEMLAAARGEKPGDATAKAAPADAKPLPKKEAPAAPAAQGGGKVDRAQMSVADMLAAARAEKQGGGAKASAAPAEKAPPAKSAPQEKSSPTPQPDAAAAKVDRSKMSVADMLAAARAEKQGGGAKATAAPAEKAPPAQEAAPEEIAQEEVAQEEVAQTAVVTAPPAKEKAAPVNATSGETVDRNAMSVDEKIAWCRAHDSKG